MADYRDVILTGRYAWRKGGGVECRARSLLRLIGYKFGFAERKAGVQQSRVLRTLVFCTRGGGTHRMDRDIR